MPTESAVKALEVYCASHEDVLEWLLEAEDHLDCDNSLGLKLLDVVKARFYNHEDFMKELKTHQGAVGEVTFTNNTIE